MAALEKSVRAAKASRGEETGEEKGEEAGARTGESAEITPLPSRRSARTAPKEVGGKVVDREEDGGEEDGREVHGEVDG